MATLLYNNTFSNVGIVPVNVIATNAANITTVLGLNICNKYDVPVSVDGYITKNGNNYYVFKNLNIDPTTTIVAIGDNQRLNIGPNQFLKLECSANNCIDVIVSYAETEVVV